MSKTYKLLFSDGTIFESITPGTFIGNRKAIIYEMLTCTATNGAITNGYARHRVFFVDEATVIAADYRSCGR